MRWSLQHARRPRQRNSTSITPWRLPSPLNALKDFFPDPRQHRLRFAYVCAWKHSGLLRVTESLVIAKLDAHMHAVNTSRGRASISANPALAISVKRAAER